MKPQSKYFGNPAEDGIRAAREEACAGKSGKKTVDLRSFKPLQDEILKLRAQNKELIDAVKTTQEFFDSMPKGQFGKISCDIGLMNDMFLKMASCLKQAEQK